MRRKRGTKGGSNGPKNICALTTKVHDDLNLPTPTDTPGHLLVIDLSASAKRRGLAKIFPKTLEIRDERGRLHLFYNSTDRREKLLPFIPAPEGLEGTTAACDLDCQVFRKYSLSAFYRNAIASEFLPCYLLDAEIMVQVQKIMPGVTIRQTAVETPGSRKDEEDWLRS